MHRVQNLLGIAFAGAAAIMIVLAIMLPFYLLFKIDYAPTLVSNTIIERTPPDTAIALQNTLGIFSFPFALMGGIMLVGMLGLLIGPLFALLRVYSLPAAIGMASLLTPALVWLLFPVHMSWLALLPLLATGPVLYVITRRDPEYLQNPYGIPRREALTRIAMFSLGGLVLTIIDSAPVLQAALGSTHSGQALFTYTPPAPRQPGFPAPGGVPEVTPVEDFYVMRKFPTPEPAPSLDWALQIDGLVDAPLTLTMKDLEALTRQDVYITRECVSNPVGGYLISCALFSGVPLAQVMNKAGVQPGVLQLKFYGGDGYEESIPVSDALERGLLAYAMNGSYLSRSHGAPLKVEIPGLYGFKNMKWLTRIEAIDTRFQSVWAKEGWTEIGIYKTMSRIDAISANPAGGATLCGVAFAGTRNVSKVEVQVNGGAWQPAELNTPPLSGQTWVQWRLDVPERGELTATVRAADGDGQMQTDTKQPQFPNGASGYQTVKVKL